jgi:hypothetical protein
MTTNDTTAARFDRAIKATRKRGVAIRQNFYSCCRGCADPFEKTRNFDEDSTPYAWTFGGQGNAVSWYNDKPYYREQLNRIYNSSRGYWGSREHALEKALATFYFNHGNGGADILVEELKREGFEPEWDGTEGQCVILSFRVKVDA